LHIVKHAGHLSNLENPGDFNKQLKLFFGRVYIKKPLLNTANFNSNLKQLKNKLSVFFAFKSI